MNNKKMKKMKKNYDVVVIGGGLAGVSTAIAASRLGCEVALVQDRSVLGGNSSSEIRVPVGGATEFNPLSRETGIIEEIFLENRQQNPRRNWAGEATTVWDLDLYKAVIKANVDVFLETCARDVTLSKDNKKIEKIICFKGTKGEFELTGDFFIDATGDGTIAFKAGAETRMGREPKSEFNESLAPDVADNYTQGSTLLFKAIDAGKPVSFNPPDWIHKYPEDSDLPWRTHQDIKSGYWWIEIGSPPYNTIDDQEIIREELLKHVLGVWDHIKNQGDHGADNLTLDWVGTVPGKRESRRIVGDYMLHENDLKECTLFPDRVAFGGWFIDIHTPGGILAMDKPPEPSFPDHLEETDNREVSVYSIPLRSLCSKDIDNLMMAGRNISATHVALGSTRLMATCAVMGQAVGTAASLCKKYNALPKQIQTEYIGELQQSLLKQDCFIPHINNNDSQDFARRAPVVASSDALLEFKEGVLGTLYDFPRQKSVSLSNLEKERSQLFPVTASQIECIEIFLESQLTESSSVELSLYSAKTVWHWEIDKEPLKKMTAKVAPGLSWVKFEIDMKVEPNRLYWIAVKSINGVFWRYSKEVPAGTVSGSKIINNWALQRGAYQMRLFPESRPYNAGNIINGVARPEEWTNIWVSDPSKGFPQNIELTFDGEISFNTVYLTFDTNLSMSHMQMPSLYRAPECVKDYALYYEDNGKWKQLLKIEGNYHRRRIHHFDMTLSGKLRLEIYSTNGDASARLYEIRVYKKHNTKLGNGQ